MNVEEAGYRQHGPTPREYPDQPTPEILARVDLLSASLACRIGLGWPFEALRKLAIGWISGATASEIGKRIGVTRNAVIGKAHRLIAVGILEPRPSPIMRGPDWVPARPQQPPRATAHTLPPLSSVLVEHPISPPVRKHLPLPFDFRVHVRRPAPEPTVVVVALPLTAKCRFPLWRLTERPTHRYCDAASPMGESWCMEHRRVVFSRWQPRVAEAAE